MIFSLPIPILSIIIANEYQNDNCQKTNDISINLSLWLYLSSIISLCTYFLWIFSRILNYYLMKNDCKNQMNIFNCTLTFIFTIYNIIISTIGSIILYRDSMECLTEGNPLGIMSQIYLILYWISIATVCCISCLSLINLIFQ
jgi:hypothetical protein